MAQSKEIVKETTSNTFFIVANIWFATSFILDGYKSWLSIFIGVVSFICYLAMEKNK